MSRYLYFDNGFRFPFVVLRLDCAHPFMSSVCFFSDFTHHVPENDGIHVLAQHVKYPPVADRHLFCNRFGNIVGYQPVVTVPQGVLPRGRVVHHKNPVK